MSYQRARQLPVAAGLAAMMFGGLATGAVSVLARLGDGPQAHAEQPRRLPSSSASWTPPISMDPTGMTTPAASTTSTTTTKRPEATTSTSAKRSSERPTEPSTTAAPPRDDPPPPPPSQTSEPPDDNGPLPTLFP